ncbi:hypothetical protein TVAG_240450 [Trichomonas vaginalis G3]|uniref:BTB domain-containing protein n=1 Tax=Trichomonas vaginalis (strain ATCC PRA-98 / G3) TaxID=412133 RepID=A2EJ92_TRIV3|nr:spectrin binding [Trichomonas vaginalis G3]EAY07244.1 hypothetical protein TVAG_240450 [Trichomonas vaginalis G3]KAI5528885.1 spectrin binding [Trichomonas vaginalis G3]|eukprot:XP_001319467.1 hypothetical protein [Trichomonas vaginalis G3]
MVQITKLCNELKRAHVIAEPGAFRININDRIINTKKSSAICFSDLIKQKYFIDRSTTSLKTNLNIICKDSIDILSNFIETGKLEFEADEPHYHDIFEIGKYFGNQILIKIYVKYVKSDKSLSIENVFKKYEVSAYENDSTTMNECIEYISSHFYSFNDDDIITNFVKNGFEFCEKILKSKELKIENEDKLCFLLLETCRRDSTLFDLFGYVNLQFCSSQVYDEIYNFSVENSYESSLLTIYNETLKNYHSKLRNKFEISNQTIASFEKHLIQNQFQISNHSFSVGIPKFVEKVSKEIHMEMSTSSIADTSSDKSTINSYSNNDQFFTKTEPNSWLKAELKGYKLKPKSYILQSRCLGSSNLLRSWKLEGIKEDGTSIELDNHSYEFKQSEIKEFPLQTNDYFVAFKITQTGKNSSNDPDNCYFFNINVFDFNGELIKI